jgi:hypothetical protein
MDPRELSRFFQRYAKQYHAGAFATPMPAEIADAQRRGLLMRWPGADGESLGTLAMSAIGKGARRRDFTGKSYLIPSGARVITHLARLDDAPIPDLSFFDYVYAYQEDRALATALAEQGREVRAIRVSASSEIIGCWGRDGEGKRYAPHDVATLTEVPFKIREELAEAALAEVAGIDAWKDDYPYYNKDGSWSAISLRGFKPEDPTYGIKPPEMSKTWWKEHPEDAKLTVCKWTVLADRCPALREIVTGVEWWGALERVRLLKLSGREGKGGKLLRHTDITDRAAGTRDGQICRFHLPLTTHPDVRTVAWDLDGNEVSVNFAPWRLWYLDQRKPHMVVNPSKVERVHLVVDVLANEAVRKRIGQSVAAPVGAHR